MTLEDDKPYRVDADTIATMVVLPVAVAHICDRLRGFAEETVKLADGLAAQTKRIAASFPELADPLAAIHLDRDQDGLISPSVALDMKNLAAGLDLVAIYQREETVEFLIGEEELLQTISVLRRPTAPMPSPPLHSVPTGP